MHQTIAGYTIFLKPSILARPALAGREFQRRFARGTVGKQVTHKLLPAALNVWTLLGIDAASDIFNVALALGTESRFSCFEALVHASRVGPSLCNTEGQCFSPIQSYRKIIIDF